MNPFMVNGRGMGWPRSIQFFVQLAWTINPEMVFSSGRERKVMFSCSVNLRSGFSSRSLFPTRLCMDVFAAVCFYPLDILFLLVMASLPYEIKDWSCLGYVSVCPLVWLSLFFLAKKDMCYFLGTIPERVFEQETCLHVVHK